ncbi:SSU ribosomal protein S6P [Rubrobacter xylanophilus DSM 9941]|uniref:Small ribosomal subunit protein bS6 n=2 Tax=Rubrobacter xylanophilus TaxID=49319 RepID=Q1AXR2_RUBXD|nr:SSU ribosomal protein S6P [Rubrobacter xylanophilus DSM 9941]
MGCAAKLSRLIAHEPLFLAKRNRQRPKEAAITEDRRIYEVMLIIIPELDEEQVQSTVSRFRTVIERTGGEVVGEPNHWGKRKLAYEIDHRSDAYYVVMEFTAGDRTLVELKRILRVSDDVLRHMIVKLPPGYSREESGERETAEVTG